jgi:Ca2+-binding RTX toxin-like protein
VLAVDAFIFEDADFTNMTSTSFKSTLIDGPLEDLSFSVKGSGFKYDGDSLVDGVITSISAMDGKNTVFRIDGKLDMDVYRPLIVKELTGSDPQALEKKLFSQDWRYTGTDAAEVATKNGLLGIDGYRFNPKGDDIIKLMGGNDNFYAGDGNDKLYGDNGNDKLYGGSGNDRVEGGAGRDLIHGGTGKDVLIGGTNIDTFLFKTGDGKDTIRDFDARGGDHDKIDLSDVASIKDWADLKAHHLVKDGADVIINAGSGDQLRLEDVKLTDLDKGDFLF